MTEFIDSQSSEISTLPSRKKIHLLFLISGLLIVLGAGIFFAGNSKYSDAKSKFQYCNSYDVNDMLSDTATGICVFEQIKVANELKAANSQKTLEKVYCYSV